MEQVITAPDEEWITYIAKMWLLGNQISKDVIGEEMDPSLHFAPQPTLRSLDEDRTEFVWQGPPFQFDRSSGTISRDGRPVTKYHAVRWIGISVQRDEGRTMSWSVIIKIESQRSVLVGTTRDETDASIAAAHLATVIGKDVRVL